MNNLLDILDKSVNYLNKKKIDNARLNVEKIFSQVLNIQRIMLYANFERELTEEELTKIREKLNDLVSSKDSNIEVKNTNNLENTILDDTNQNISNVKTILEKSINYLQKNNIEEANLIAEILFSHILNVDRMMLFTKYKESIEEDKLEKIRNYLQKIGREKFPIQYLLNEQQFYGRAFYVNTGVLIPRQDTEVLVYEALSILKNIENPKILDIGSGSGVIGITIALEKLASKVIGVDISDKAIEISNKNKKLLKVENINFLKSNLFENIEYKKFDMIVSNPPYIASDEIGLMSDDTLLHEPNEALFSEDGGLYFYNEISRQSIEYLREGGHLLFEIGYKQGEKVKKIMELSGFKDIKIIKDIEQLDRVVIGTKGEIL